MPGPVAEQVVEQAGLAEEDEDTGEVELSPLQKKDFRGAILTLAGILSGYWLLLLYVACALLAAGVWHYVGVTHVPWLPAGAMVFFAFFTVAFIACRYWLPVVATMCVLVLVWIWHFVGDSHVGWLPVGAMALLGLFMIGWIPVHLLTRASRCYRAYLDRPDAWRPSRQFEEERIHRETLLGERQIIFIETASYILFPWNPKMGMVFKSRVAPEVLACVQETLQRPEFLRKRPTLLFRILFPSQCGRGS
jgi:hypothetical protein